MLPVLPIVQPVERRERDDPGVEPAVPHLFDAFAVGAALRAADDDLVDPRPVQLAQLVESALRELAQLLLASDDEEVLVRARIERKRKAPVALAADVPVAHVQQPVLHPAAGGRREPRDLRCRFDEPRPQLVHRDEPFVVHPEDDLLVATPALGVAVDIVGGAEEQTPLLEVVGDLARNVARFLPLEPPVARDKARVLVDRDQHRKLLGLREREVLGTAARGDVHEPSPFGRGHVLPLDDAMPRDPRARRGKLVERSAVAQAQELAGVY